MKYAFAHLIIVLALFIACSTGTSQTNIGPKTIVIDAGHGGKDPGTHGQFSKEKDIVLDIALRLGKLIESSAPWLNVRYTRDSDVFIPLHERTQIANEEAADLFISIHCNHFGQSSVHGTEIYVMGLHKTEENLDVAKRENASMLLEENYDHHYDGYDPDSDEAHILMSMFQFSYLQESINFGMQLIRIMGDSTDLHMRGVKQAGFVVLKRATMPSILLETGYISNDLDESYLNSEEGKNQIAKSVFESIVLFYPNEEKPLVHTDYHVVLTESFDKMIDNLDTKWNFVNSYSIKQEDKTFQYITGPYNSLAEAKHKQEFYVSKGFSESKIITLDD